MIKLNEFAEDKVLILTVKHTKPPIVVIIKTLLYNYTGIVLF